MIKSRMDEQFRELRNGVRRVITYKPREHDELIAEVLLDLWKSLHAQGVQAFDFAHTALLLSESVMSHYESPKENVHFGEYLQKAGARKIKIFSDAK